MLRKKNKEIYAAEVRYFGAVDQTHGEIRAWVSAPSNPPEIGYGRNALALLIPLAGVKLLVLSTSAPAFTEPMQQSFNRAADLLLGGASDLHNFKLEDPELPTFITETEGEIRTTWNACLMKSREGGYWVKGGGPLQGGPSFGLWGVLGLVEHAARTYPYEETVLPVAAGLKTLIEVATRHEGEWQAMGDAAEDFFGSFVASVVASPDPLDTMEQIKQAIA